jgi:hypothetical protein
VRIDVVAWLGMKQQSGEGGGGGELPKYASSFLFPRKSVGIISHYGGWRRNAISFFLKVP